MRVRFVGDDVIEFVERALEVLASPTIQERARDAERLANRDIVELIEAPGGLREHISTLRIAPAQKHIVPDGSLRFGRHVGQHRNPVTTFVWIDGGAGLPA